jgi:hypothetical protein
MVKRNKKRRSRSEAREKPIAPAGKWKSLLRKLWSPVPILLTCVSFVTAAVGLYFEFKPKLSLEPDLPFKSNSVIETPFRVTNQSLLPIYNVKQEWWVEEGRVKFPGSPEKAYELERIETPPIPTYPILYSSQPATVYPFENIDTSEVAVRHLKLMVIITYQKAILHWKRTQTFTFEGNAGVDGSFHWYHTLENR